MSDVLDKSPALSPAGDSETAVPLIMPGPGVHVVDEIDGAIVVVEDIVTVEIRVLDLREPVVIIDPAPNLPPPTSPFDIDLQSIVRQPGEAVRVVVDLTDPNYEFMTDEYNVTAGNGASIPFLRREPGGTATHLEFYIIRGANGRRLTFNYGAVVKATGLPFHVDPKVENNG